MLAFDDAVAGLEKILWNLFERFLLMLLELLLTIIWMLVSWGLRFLCFLERSVRQLCGDVIKRGLHSAIRR